MNTGIYNRLRIVAQSSTRATIAALQSVEFMLRRFFCVSRCVSARGVFPENRETR